MAIDWNNVFTAAKRVGVALAAGTLFYTGWCSNDYFANRKLNQVQTEAQARQGQLELDVNAARLETERKGFEQEKLRERYSAYQKVERACPLFIEDWRSRGRNYCVIVTENERGKPSGYIYQPEIAKDGKLEHLFPLEDRTLTSR